MVGNFTGVYVGRAREADEVIRRARYCGQMHNYTGILNVGTLKRLDYKLLDFVLKQNNFVLHFPSSP